MQRGSEEDEGKSSSVIRQKGGREGRRKLVEEGGMG